jgi:hypothetical protein
MINKAKLALIAAVAAVSVVSPALAQAREIVGDDVRMNLSSGDWAITTSDRPPLH